MTSSGPSETDAARLSIIAAMSEDGVIGYEGKLPWHLPGDLKLFKSITTGHTVIMGRKTYDSMGQPLPRRRNIVVTRNKQWSATGVEVAHDLDDAIAMAGADDEVFIIGGGEIYRQALPRMGRLYLTQVNGKFAGDAFFPQFDTNDWILTTREFHPRDETHAYVWTFSIYDRRS